MINNERISITADSVKECKAKYIAMKYGVIEARKKQKTLKKTLKTALTECIDARSGLPFPAHDLRLRAL